jgi:hypothetical protein
MFSLLGRSNRAPAWAASDQNQSSIALNGHCDFEGSSLESLVVLTDLLYQAIALVI